MRTSGSGAKENYGVGEFLIFVSFKGSDEIDLVRDWGVWDISLLYLSSEIPGIWGY